MTISPYAIPGLPKEPNSQKVAKVKQAVCDVTGISWDRICGFNRKRELVRARGLFCYVTYSTLSSVSLDEIGRWLQGRDHSTVIHAIDSIKDFLDQEDEDTTEDYTQILKSIYGKTKPPQREKIRIKTKRSAKKIIAPKMPVKIERPPAEYSNKQWTV